MSRLYQNIYLPPLFIWPLLYRIEADNLM